MPRVRRIPPRGTSPAGRPSGASTWPADRRRDRSPHTGRTAPYIGVPHIREAAGPGGVVEATRPVRFGASNRHFPLIIHSVKRHQPSPDRFIPIRIGPIPTRSTLAGRRGKPTRRGSDRRSARMRGLTQERRSQTDDPRPCRSGHVSASPGRPADPESGACERVSSYARHIPATECITSRHTVNGESAIRAESDRKFTGRDDARALRVRSSRL